MHHSSFVPGQKLLVLYPSSLAYLSAVTSYIQVFFLPCWGAHVFLCILWAGFSFAMLLFSAWERCLSQPPALAYRWSVGKPACWLWLLFLGFLIYYILCCCRARPEACEYINLLQHFLFFWASFHGCLACGPVGQLLGCFSTFTSHCWPSGVFASIRMFQQLHQQVLTQWGSTWH